MIRATQRPPMVKQKARNAAVPRTLKRTGPITSLPCAAKVPMSSAQALEALRTMHVVDIRVGAEIRRGVTAGNHQARQILAALGISDREPLQTQSSEKMPA